MDLPPWTAIVASFQPSGRRCCRLGRSRHRPQATPNTINVGFSSVPSGFSWSPERGCHAAPGHARARGRRPRAITDLEPSRASSPRARPCAGSGSNEFMDTTRMCTHLHVLAGVPLVAPVAWALSGGWSVVASGTCRWSFPIAVEVIDDTSYDSRLWCYQRAPDPGKDRVECSANRPQGHRKFTSALTAGSPPLLYSTSLFGRLGRPGRPPRLVSSRRSPGTAQSTSTRSSTSRSPGTARPTSTCWASP